MVPSGTPPLQLWVEEEPPVPRWRLGWGWQSLTLGWVVEWSSSTPAWVGEWQAIWSQVGEGLQLMGSGEGQGLTLMVRPFILYFVVLRDSYVSITLLYFLLLIPGPHPTQVPGSSLSLLPGGPCRPRVARCNARVPPRPG